MEEYKISDFFFLDQSFPFLLRTGKSGERRCAARVSQYESVETALSMSGIIKWIWIDVFNGLHLTNDEFLLLKQAGFDCCLVSPELQGYPQDSIPRIQAELLSRNIRLEAVCTKFPSLWLNH